MAQINHFMARSDRLQCAFGYFFNQNPRAAFSFRLAASSIQISTGRGLYVAKLGIADLLKHGPKGVDELAQVTNTHAPSLYRLLRAVASLGIFAEDDQRRFALTAL